LVNRLIPRGAKLALSHFPAYEAREISIQQQSCAFIGAHGREGGPKNRLETALESAGSRHFEDKPARQIKACAFRLVTRVLHCGFANEIGHLYKKASATSRERVEAAFRIIFADEHVRAVLINIFSGVRLEVTNVGRATRRRE
jgi:hypothetical protein